MTEPRRFAGVVQVLRLPGFARLFLASTTSVFGDALIPVALAFAVLDLTGSPTDIAVVLVASEVPQVALVLFGGVVSDRFPRQRVMVISHLVAAASYGLLGALLITGTAELWHMVVLSGINGAAIAFFFPAAIGLVPQIVPKDQLQAANALFQLARSSARIGGVATAGVLVATAGAGVAVALDAATFALSAVLLLGIRVPAVMHDGGASVLHQMREGWRDFVSRRWLWVVVLQFCFVNAAYAGALGVLGPVLADRHLGGASSWAAVLVGQSVGLVVGGVVALRIRSKHPMLVATVAVLSLVPFLALLGLASPLPVIIVAAFVAGAGLQVFGVLWSSALQAHVPERLLSRVTSYDIFGSFVFNPLGVAVAGPLAVAIGAGPSLMAAATVAGVATLLALSVQEVRRLPALPLPGPAT